MKIDVTDTSAAIPDLPGEHRLLGRNTGSSTIYFGFRESVVGDDDDLQGIPIEAGEMFEYSGIDKYQDSLYLVCATGESSTFNYDVQ